MIPLKIAWHASTDVGAVREINEDRYFASPELGLWAVADGMGGMARGDWAASQVVGALAQLGPQASLQALVLAAGQALIDANERILTESEQRGQQMGSTAVLLFVQGNSFSLVWVGDSRAYLVRDERLHRLTKDHSQVQELLDRGLIDADAAATHPLRNVLTRAVGVGRPLAFDTITDVLEPDDLLLLCSDGLHGVVGEAEMEAILRDLPIEDAAERLIRRCHELGAPDNITLVAVTANEATLVRFGDVEASVGP